MKTAILSTGSELVRGVIPDTNAAWLSRHLLKLGVQVEKTIVIGDSRTLLAATLKEIWGSYDLLLCTGGLGPTTDDVTACAVADALNLPLERNTDAVRQIKERFAFRGVPMAEINLKQADVPKGCTLLENPFGTAPGFQIETMGCKSFFFPGVPSEMKGMFDLHIRPILGQNQIHCQYARFRTFGIGESALQELLLPIEAQFPAVVFSYRAAFPEIVTTISSESADALGAAETELASQLQPFCFSTGDQTLAEAVGALLITQNKTISTAESCTGGMICSELTDIPGASAYVLGAVVAYDNRIKTDVLGVSAESLDRHGAVSEEVVVEMARGVQRRMNSNVTIATSGIAGPQGGSDDKPVGTVHIAVAIEDRIFHKKCLFKGYSRTKVKTATTWTALQMVRHHLLEKL